MEKAKKGEDGERKKQGQEIRGRGEGLGVTRLGRTTIQSQE